MKSHFLQIDGSNSFSIAGIIEFHNFFLQSGAHSPENSLFPSVSRESPPLPANRVINLKKWSENRLGFLRHPSPDYRIWGMPISNRTPHNFREYLFPVNRPEEVIQSAVLKSYTGINHLGAWPEAARTPSPLGERRQDDRPPLRVISKLLFTWQRQRSDAEKVQQPFYLVSFRFISVIRSVCAEWTDI